jgi:hypothetical protein
VQTESLGAVPRWLRQRVHLQANRRVVRALPDWQRDLWRRVASGALDEPDRREVMRILAGAPDAPAPIPLALEDLPADEGEHGQVELRAIREVPATANTNR